MAFAPLLDSPAVIGTPEVVFILRSLQPPALTLRFALFAAGRLRAVALMTQIAMIGTIELFTAKAFAPGGTPSLGQLKKRKLPLPQDRFSTPIKIRQQANEIEEVRTKRRKVLY
jgi:hypothetical protein